MSAHYPKYRRQVTVDMTEAQYKSLVAQARHAHTSRASFIRSRALMGRAPRRLRLNTLAIKLISSQLETTGQLTGQIEQRLAEQHQRIEDALHTKLSQKQHEFLKKHTAGDSPSVSAYRAAAQLTLTDDHSQELKNIYKYYQTSLTPQLKKISKNLVKVERRLDQKL